jgi:predicted glycosyltransferase
MVTGPMMDDDTHDRLARAAESAGVSVHRVVPELRAHIAFADCVISMAGYNTCCDLLTFRRPSVIVPRPGPSQEQTIRTQRLDDWGVANVLDPDEADPHRFASAIVAALDGPPPPAAPISLGGLDAAVRAFDLALAAPRAAA